MTWPQATDLCAAIAHPVRCFRDTELKRGQPVLGPEGVPVAYPGESSVVYEIRCTANQSRWAVKCYTKPLPDLTLRYQVLAEMQQQANLPGFVDGYYQDQGICVRGRWSPILKMRWVEGVTLAQFV